VVTLVSAGKGPIKREHPGVNDMSSIALLPSNITCKLYIEALS